MIEAISYQQNSSQKDFSPFSSLQEEISPEIYEDERNLAKRFEYDEDGDVTIYGRINLAKAHSNEPDNAIVYAPTFLVSELNLTSENPYLSQLKKHAETYSIVFPDTQEKVGEFIYTSAVDHLDPDKWMPVDFITLERFVTSQEDEYTDILLKATGPKDADTCCEITLENGEEDHWHGAWHLHNKGQFLMSLALAGSERAKAVINKLIEEDEAVYEALGGKRLQDLPEDERLIVLSDIMILRKNKEAKERVSFEVPKFIEDTAKSVVILASGNAENNPELKEQLQRVVSNDNTGWFRYDTPPSDDEKLLNKNASEQFTKALLEARKQWNIKSPEQIQDALRLLLNTPFAKEQEAEFLSKLSKLDPQTIQSLKSEQIAAILIASMEISTRPGNDDLTEQEVLIMQLATLLQEQGHFFVNWRSIKEGMKHPKGAHGAIGANGSMSGCCSSSSAASAASAAATTGSSAMRGSNGAVSTGAGASTGGRGGEAAGVGRGFSTDDNKSRFYRGFAQESKSSSSNYTSNSSSESMSPRPHAVINAPRPRLQNVLTKMLVQEVTRGGKPPEVLKHIATTNNPQEASGRVFITRESASRPKPALSLVKEDTSGPVDKSDATPTTFLQVVKTGGKPPEAVKRMKKQVTKQLLHR